MKNVDSISVEGIYDSRLANQDCLRHIGFCKSSSSGRLTGVSIAVSVIVTRCPSRHSFPGGSLGIGATAVFDRHGDAARPRHRDAIRKTLRLRLTHFTGFPFHTFSFPRFCIAVPHDNIIRYVLSNDALISFRAFMASFIWCRRCYV